ncbi:hypothetical protein D3OALGA1CA_279 [Olavius algarvensis associated proteobacterium Delta 3]|nr:hypothetical protein D3OALGA1CA_279 [Olavius algarvensis associated proteobacterium Delta 3]CAB5098296.1 hypothetical protein D3OALGB2SA_1666 [Olavius algarvensis associated proteobacterium Delta 3]
MKHISCQYLELLDENTVRHKTPWRVSIFSLVVFLMTVVFLEGSPVYAQELVIRQSDAPLVKNSTKPPVGQLPLSRVAEGEHDIRRAWFAGPTSRYTHGVLGDAIEASQLVVETRSGHHIIAQLPPDRVFEDLEPRVVNLTGDQTDEILAIETHLQQGASLVVYDLVGDGLVPIAATPFLGKAYRWLNPVGVGDFDGDGAVDVALVATPHIGGILRLYRVNGDQLSLFAEYAGVSTHHIGSTELGLGRVVSTSPRDHILVPNQARRRLMLLEWTPHGWREHDHADVPGVLETSLIPVGPHQWRFQVDTGISYDVFVVQ